MTTHTVGPPRVQDGSCIRSHRGDSQAAPVRTTGWS